MSAEVSAAFPYAAPLGYPVDELLIMHRLTREKAIELHSCGIVREDGTGNLFVGHSGAGKSTTTRLWMEREDVEILSDDRIIVRRDDRTQKQVPPLRSAKGRNDKASIRNDKGNMRIYGTPWHGEAAYASPGSARLAKIFILEHGQGNVLTRLSASQAVAELFARSFVPFHRHEYVESALEFLQELVSAVPCYRYAFEPNKCAVERIVELCD
jgi:ABC-type multidrug transport system ATPase subunit